MSFKTKHLKNQIGPYFIAEIGINHNGIVELAKKDDRRVEECRG